MKVGFFLASCKALFLKLNGSCVINASRDEFSLENSLKVLVVAGSSAADIKYFLEQILYQLYLIFSFE